MVEAATPRLMKSNARLGRDDFERLRPRSKGVDNGPEFAGKLFNHWVWLNRVELDV